MYKYKGMLMTTFPDNNKIVLEKQILLDLVAQNPRVPVRLNFVGSSIGVTTGFGLEENESAVVCYFESEIADLDALGLFVVPGHKANLRDLELLDNDLTLVKRTELVEVSLTPRPSDKRLSNIISVLG